MIVFSSEYALSKDYDMCIMISAESTTITSLTIRQ